MLQISLYASLIFWKYQELRWWALLIYFVIFGVLIYYKIMDRAELPTSFRELGKWIVGVIGLFFFLYATWWIANYGH
jgi:hypothetical protein